MFIYSFKRPRDIDLIREAYEEKRKATRLEYFMQEPMQPIPSPTQVLSVSQQMALLRKSDKAGKKQKDNLLKKYDSIIYSTENESQIHSYRRRLQLTGMMYIHYSSTDEHTSPVQDVNDQKSYTPTPHNREHKLISRLTNSITKKDGDKAYLLTPRIQTERYLQEFQPKIMSMMQASRKEMSLKQESKFLKKTAFAPLNMEKYFQGLISILNYERITNLQQNNNLMSPHLRVQSRESSEHFQKHKSQLNIKRAANLQVAVTKIHGIERGISFETKYHIYVDFINVINMSNEIIVTPAQKENFIPYKAVINKANNGAIVRACLKQRWWWVLGDRDDSLDKIQFLWTSWKKQKMIKLLKSCPNKRFKEITLSKLVFQQEQVQNHRVKNLRFGKWKHLRKLLNEQQICEVYEAQSKSNPKNILNLSGPFVFENPEKTVYQHLMENFNQTNFNQFAPSQWKLHNHLEHNATLHSKKHLLQNLKNYYLLQNLDPFDYMPLTFHIKQGQSDPEFQNFTDAFRKLKTDSDITNVSQQLQQKYQGSVWIVKPGENSNRGIGIQVFSKFQDIQAAVNNKEYHTNGKRFTYIVQKYIEKPLLFKQRKFDIRCYTLITSVNGKIKAYWYRDCYVRTSSKEYNLKNLDNRLIHLTNDAVQKKSEEYGKFEFGNKVSQEDFQKYLEKLPTPVNFIDDIFPKCRQMAIDSVKSVFQKIDPLKRINTFELFGLDFMLDEEFRPWLIEFNANPCLEISCSVLNRIITNLIENVWKVAIDPLFPPPPLSQWPKNKRNLIPDNIYANNRFEVIFDEFHDGPNIRQPFNVEIGEQIEEISDDDICDDD